MTPADKHQNTLGDYVLHLGVGFVRRERPHVIAALSTLRWHLGRWDPHEVGLEVSLQDRGRREQRVTLRTTLPGHTPLVATGDSADIARALYDAKSELIRQIDERDSQRWRADYL